MKINGKKILLTENIKAKNGAYIAQEPIMDKISIDHKESMHELIKKSEKTCKNLQHISKDILDFSKDKKMRKDEIAREFFSNKGAEYSKEFVDILVQETCGLFCVMEFVAMDKAQNSSKNDNI